MNASGIYIVTHIGTGRQYVGKSVNVRVRWNEHVRECKNYNNKFYNALAKYGRQSFIWEVIEECAKDHLSEREKYWISATKSAQYGFNCTPGGDGLSAGFKHSPEERAAKSARQKGKPHSQEHNRKVAEALRGRQNITPHVLEVLRSNAEAMRGKPNILSEETRAKIRAAGKRRIGIWKSPPGAHAKQWETRRVKYGNSGLSKNCLQSRKRH